MRRPRPQRAHRRENRPEKPRLRLQTTTLWEYPSQHYGDRQQGDQAYVGATPSYVIWNLLQRYTAPGDLVVDPFCGSGTTLDVAKDTGREARGFDVAPYRPDIEAGDARQLPLESGSVDLVFMDPPYGDHVHYSDDPRCIGKLSAREDRYFQEMRRAIFEGVRVLKPGGIFGLYVCDFYKKQRAADAEPNRPPPPAPGFVPVGFELFAIMMERLAPVDVVSVVRHNKALKLGNYHQAAERENFFLRGFNYLFIGQSPGEKPGKARR